MKKSLSLSLACIILIACTLSFAGCDLFGNNLPENEKTDDAISFTLVVVHLDGTEKSFDLETNNTILADALVEQGYISGYESEYGLTIETVDGETLDWETSSAYWAFYINGEYATTGVSSTYVEEGATYTFKAEKM